MTHLTSLNLDVRNRHVAADLADSNNLHRTVMRLVATTEPEATVGQPLRAATGTLFRLANTGLTAELLVQSHVLPDTTTLPDGYLLTRRDLDLDPILDQITTGDRIRYTLIAAPIRNVLRRNDTGAQMRGKKVPLRNVSDVADWWTTKTPALGLRILTDADEDPLLRIDPAPFTYGRKRSDTGDHLIRHRAYRIAGIATVTDPTLLRHAVTDGVGPARAYGMGLLTVTPQ